MARHLTRFRKWGGGRLLGVALLGVLAGCVSNDVLPLPPGGFLEGDSYAWTSPQAETPANRAEADKKPAAKSVRKKADAVSRETAAQAAAAEKQAAAEEKARLREEKKQAAAAEKDRLRAEKEKTAAEKSAAEKPASAKRPSDTEPAPAAAASDAYVLQAGDEIEIQVYREPELSGTFKLNAAGEIRHSLAGAVPMAGKTVEEAEADFTQRLAKDYLVNPRVIVRLASTQSSQVVVLGEVAKPGVYPLPFGEKMTLLQAIAGAGGFTELASPDRVSLVRRRPDGGQTTLKIRVSDLLGGKGKQPDVPLEPNDVIMVPQVFF